MSFKTEMQNMAVDLINRVFGSEGEVSQTVTIMHPELSNIDEATDKIYTNKVFFDVLGILGPWEKDAIPGQTGLAIKTNDQRLVVAYTDLEFIPTVDVDTVSIQDGSVYLITSSTIDAAEATCIMQLRRVKGAPRG